MFKKLIVLLMFGILMSVNSVSFGQNNKENAFQSLADQPDWLSPGTCVVALDDLGCGVYQGTTGVYWGTNEATPPAYVVWDEGGGCASAIPDTAPFTSSSSQHQDMAYWVDWDEIGPCSDATSTSTSTDTTCDDRYNEGFEAGKSYCQTHLAECGITVGEKECPEYECEPCSSTVGTTSADDSCKASFNLFTNTLHVPCLSMGDEYWLDLKLINSEPVQLEMTSFGTK